VADAHSLTNLSDLAKVSADITLGAPPEFEGRSPFGIVGFKQIYGAGDFKKFVPLASTDVAAALKSGVIDCGNLFSTDPDITANDFVSLDDDKTTVPHEAVLPLLTTKAATQTVLSTVDAISATLTTDVLKQLVVETVTDKKAPNVVAAEYLASLSAS
jgi:osmoprotectant transport system substrate-binding protein